VRGSLFRSELSRDHFAVDREIGRDGNVSWSVRDLRSSGGIFVNGRRNGEFDVEDIPLIDGDEIMTSSSTTFRFHVVGERITE